MPFDSIPNREAYTKEQLNGLRLARFIEHTWSGFNMDSYEGQRCGTPGCIAGHACYMWPEIEHPDAGEDMSKYAPDYEKFAEKIGVGYGDIYFLCEHWTDRKRGGLDAMQITPKIAAAAVRRLVLTGEAYFSLEDG